MAPNFRPEEVALPPSPEPSAKGFSDNSHLIPSPSLVPVRPSSPLRRVSSPDQVSTPDYFSQLPYRPRTQSPLSRGHLRSHSSSPTLSAPPMTRAHSSPTPDTSIRPLSAVSQVRPASPLNGQGRRRSPLRSTMEESYPSTPTWSGLSIEPNIPEHAELDTSATSRALSDVDFGRSSSPIHHTFPRTRRRPSSPLYQSGVAQNAFSNPPTVSPSPRSSQSSPILNPQKYANESYPNYSFGSVSSMPSTPTSFRSRSPSISSLETIPDSPDAEEAAQMEVEELMRTRSKEGEDGDSSNDGDGPGLRRRSSLEMRGYGLAKDKRKRWSVCGAERRADLDVIWED